MGCASVHNRVNRSCVSMVFIRTPYFYRARKIVTEKCWLINAQLTGAARTLRRSVEGNLVAHCRKCAHPPFAGRLTCG